MSRENELYNNFWRLSRKGMLRWMPDKIHIRIGYFLAFGRRLDLANPVSFSEKLQWLKLYNRKSEYVAMVDKFLVKEIVAKKIGMKHIIPTLGVWSKFDDIDFEQLPEQFVIKCTHDSGGVIIVKDKNSMNYESTKSIIEQSLKLNYYDIGREWPYKNVIPKIIIEPYLLDEKSGELPDYKFMCFNGKVECIFVCTERGSEDGVRITIFDRSWNKLSYERFGHPSSDNQIEKPNNWDEMIGMAETLSKELPFVRVDLYEVNGEVYFGEYTFFPAGGLERFQPESADYELGKKLNLTRII